MDIGLRLLTDEEQESMAVDLTPPRLAALEKAFLLLGAGKDRLSAKDLENAVKAVTDTAPSARMLEELAHAVSSGGSGSLGAVGSQERAGELVTLEGLRKLLRTGKLHPAHKVSKLSSQSVSQSVSYSFNQSMFQLFTHSSIYSFSVYSFLFLSLIF